jgi:hypothetical protein
MRDRAGILVGALVSLAQGCGDQPYGRPAPDAATPTGMTDLASPLTDGSLPSDDAGTDCYVLVGPSGVHSLDENRDRLIADLAKRKCIDRCALWAQLNLAERYVFLMDTGYLGAPASQLYPPSAGKAETALDHAVALYSINGPKAGQGIDGSGLGGNDYNRIYLGFDDLAKCVMRNFQNANPAGDPKFNRWQQSDGPPCAVQPSER